MKKLAFLSLLLLAFNVASFAQDYTVTSVEHLENDMTARKTVLTEKVKGGQKCAVLRIATRNIVDVQRDLFLFECDMGSVIRERRKDGGEICLWVSPGIKFLKIKHPSLGNYLLNIPEVLNGNVQSLNTYRVTIVGSQETPKETLSYGNSQMVVVPTPRDAILLINGDSIGPGIHSIPTLAGDYHWTFKHPLYHTATGTLTVHKGEIDTVFASLDPAYGYMKILSGYSRDEDVELAVYINGIDKGNVPYESDKLAQGIYEVVLKAEDSIVKSISQIEIKEHLVSVNRADELCLNYEKMNNLNNDPDFSIDSSFQAKQTRFYPIMGKVTINSNPRSAVTIDSVYFGLTPITIDTLSVGTHNLVLTAEKYTPLEQEINIEEENETTYYLQLTHSCIATIITDMEGDQVYVNKEFVGKSPVTIERPFGTYSVYILRPGQASEEGEIKLTPNELEPTFVFPLGQTITVETGNRKSKIYLDRKYSGRTPMQLYVLNGKHLIRAEHGWSEGEKYVTVSRDNPIGNLEVKTHIQKPTAFLSNGAFFLTGNVGLFNKGGETVYGLNIGDIAKGGHAGWFISLMTNTSFVSQIYGNNYSVLNAYLKANENGEVINGSVGHNYSDSGERSFIRASALFGVALKVGGPVYLRVAGGYGIRRDTWKTTHDEYVIVDPRSWQDFEASLGLQLCLYNIVINADALIPVMETLTNKSKGTMLEARVGLGFCLKHKK